MLTKWGKKLISLPYNASGSPILKIPNTSQTVGMIRAKGCLGTDYILTPITYGVSYSTLFTSYVESTGTASYGFAVGSGDTPATENDYCLDSILSGLSLSSSPSVQMVYDSSTGKFNLHVDLTLSNNTENDIIIKEIGSFFTAYTSETLGGAPTTGAYYQKSFMLSRVVLDSPVTIGAGQSGVVRYIEEYQMDSAE